AGVFEDVSGAERWAQVGEIFHGAMERRDEDRSRFLDSVCGDDAGLRAEVESLLASTMDHMVSMNSRFSASVRSASAR
ncbi:MAG: hypothetical protein AAFN05_14380, partial [Pseudomonadota bacterium]